MNDPIVLSSSSLDTAQKCMRRFKFEKIDLLKPFSKSVALERGDLIHHMLEVFYQNRINLIQGENTWSVSAPQYAQMIQAAILAGRKHTISLALAPAEAEEAINAFKEYAIFNKADRWIPTHAESPFCYHVGTFDLGYGDQPIYFEGKIDLIVKTGQKFVVVDHKSRSRRRDTSMLSNQYMSYCLAAGVNTVIENVIGLQKSLKSEEKFTRKEFEYSDNQLQEWVENVVAWVKEIVKAKETGQFLPNFTTCVGPTWSCPFREACETPAHRRDFYISQNFKVTQPHDLFTEKIPTDFEAPQIVPAMPTEPVDEPTE